MNNPDIRWKQRFHNYRNALAQLTEAVELARERPLSNIEQLGLIKLFEFTHELAWNVTKDYFAYQGSTTIMGSRDATREAFQAGMIEDGEGWMEMIKTRNKAVHTYDEATVSEVMEQTTNRYFPLFQAFERKMSELAGER